ncbi:MAG TPA: RNA polymerase subunit sigma [Verrucomicrobiales bacterium]|nr:RNA polymerase subunit sigma [Verrucomicrobiales bacterium]HCN77669.1 RNA polymerase subunit sigma [Verrucomicrobiales bacterium]HRJ08102.1 sigma-70 family RNA polymerase sigma factor [Prosthecobacter sp.]HRK15744.1 sigma-70 family RNA polymerase sigma factor [Prosthecobacter sp.]
MDDATTAFLELLTKHERPLSLYVHGLVPRDSAAEDILQQTKMLLWKHFKDFEPGTNFLAWARKTAFHQILTHRRQKKREHLPLDEVALEALGHAVSDLAVEGSARQDALRACMARLPVEHRRLISLRYFEEMEIGQIAGRIRRSEMAVYRALSRIRMTLMQCIEKQMEAHS